MNSPLRAVLACTSFSFMTALAASAESRAWKLVWSDEFAGPEIDLSKWEFEVNANGGGNNELQYYTDRRENARIEDGRLVIEARKESFTGPAGTREYTSARLRTQNKGDWKFGRFEIRAKLPRTQGLWPAIWMLPTDWKYGGWPRGRTARVSGEQSSAGWRRVGADRWERRLPRSARLVSQSRQWLTTADCST